MDVSPERDVMDDIRAMSDARIERAHRDVRHAAVEVLDEDGRAAGADLTLGDADMRRSHLDGAQRLQAEAAGDSRAPFEVPAIDPDLTHVVGDDVLEASAP